MPEKNKRIDQKKEECEKSSEKNEVPQDDQKIYRYYYDDAHGYEVYQPGEDEED